MINDGIRMEDLTMRSFLMIGQSNMAGRGEFGDVEDIVNPLCYMLRMGRWQKMSEPINPDRSIFSGRFHSGRSLAASFADEVAKHTEQKVGLIPCADGGTKIAQWMPGELLFDHAVYMTKLAMRTSKLSGILWHQGESDCGSDEKVAIHKENFIKMITALRKELNAEDVPVIIGELSLKTDEQWGQGDRPAKMNQNYHAIAKELPFCSVVSSEGLSLKEDMLHFDSVSLREFGKRYFEAYKQIANI